MTRPRRFRLDSATAAEFEAPLTESAWRIMLDNGGASDDVHRARRLLLHWWARGLNPRTAMLRCPECEGTGRWVDRLLMIGWRCCRCHGTGRLDSAPNWWRWDCV